MTVWGGAGGVVVHADTGTMASATATRTPLLILGMTSP